MLDLAIGDLGDGGRDGDRLRSRSNLLDLAVGDLLHDSDWGGSLLDLTVADLSSEGGGNEGQGENDFLNGRHCDEDRFDGI